MASDARADAKMLGPERTAALVGAVLDDFRATMNRNPAPEWREWLEAAARRLAAPEPAAPQWPERVWAAFRSDTGDWGGCSKRHNEFGPGWHDAPARLVPLDGSRVVLTREDALVLREAIRRPRVEFMDPGPPIIRWPDGTAEALAALDRALADTEGT